VAALNRNDLQQLANMRLAEAQALLAAGYYAGAYYLAGYAIECALKACIAKDVRQFDFPDKTRVNRSWSHDLAELARTAELEADLMAARKADPVFESNWHIVKDWSETNRYNLTLTPAQASNLIAAISDPNNGILQWITQRW
jgi:HEPN domain-containing protein